ncbi:hypothetical protein BB561_003113 [Smittium simulii]|uniref:Uncharacterized protein n=1 Tax=Smittium simulii TaxID=133385 RepID=A0A2T9YMV0_9FUNG|nr:hypothetical protein BB561_003113 [Smittium simulii]
MDFNSLDTDLQSHVIESYGNVQEWDDDTRIGNEGDVSGVADSLLYLSGFNLDNRFRTTYENILTDNSRPDVRVEIFDASHDLQPVMVIELKRRHSDYNTIQKYIKQLRGYMLVGNFPHVM